MDSAQQKMKRNIRILILLFLCASVLMAILGLISDQHAVKRMTLLLSLAFFVSAMSNWVLLKAKSDSFKEKPGPDYGNYPDERKKDLN